MSGGILQLAADTPNSLNVEVQHINTTNITNNLLPNIATEIFANIMQKLNNNTYKINQQRYSDIILPEYLVFEFVDNISVDDFMDVVIKDTSFRVEIGGHQIWNIPLYLCANLNKPKKIGNKKISLKLSFDMLISGIDVVALQLYEINYYLNNINYLQYNDLENISVVVKGTYIDTPIRQQIAQQPHETLIQQIQYKGEEIHTSLYMVGLNFNNLTKGYFIEGNIDLITNFELLLNGHIRWKYDETLLSLYAKRISDNLIYIPFNTDNLDNYKLPAEDRTSYIGSLNSSRIDNTVMNFIFSENYHYQGGNQIKIYALSAEKFRYGYTNGGGSGLGTAMLSNGSDYININNNINNNIITTSTQIHEISSLDEWEIINKLINLDRNNECPISLSPFNDNDKYCMCSTCNCNFSYDAFKDWIIEAPHKVCPTCRSQWTELVVYVNNESNI